MTGWIKKDGKKDMKRGRGPKKEQKEKRMKIKKSIERNLKKKKWMINECKITKFQDEKIYLKRRKFSKFCE